MQVSENKSLTPAAPSGWKDFLGLVPMHNQAAKTGVEKTGALSIEIAIRRPWFLMPPLSWILPISPRRVVVLDALGTSIWSSCDGIRTIGSLVEDFAGSERLSFHEARILITQQLREMVRRGCIVLVGNLKQNPSSPGGSDA